MQEPQTLEGTAHLVRRGFFSFLEDSYQVKHRQCSRRIGADTMLTLILPNRTVIVAVYAQALKEATGIWLVELRQRNEHIGPRE